MGYLCPICNETNPKQKFKEYCVCCGLGKAFGLLLAEEEKLRPELSEYRHHSSKQTRLEGV